MKIKMLIMDVDGTLTDGKVYYGTDGTETKAFHIKDGYGIKHLLPNYGILPVIITGRTSNVVSKRAKELGIHEVHQGIADKIKVLLELKKKYCLEKRHIAYIGDDLIDIECMKECGIIGCPADAVKEIREIADYVCCLDGGEGAVREFIDFLCSVMKQPEEMKYEYIKDWVD